MNFVEKLNYCKEHKLHIFIDNQLITEEKSNMNGIRKLAEKNAMTLQDVTVLMDDEIIDDLRQHLQELREFITISKQLRSK